VICQQPPLLPYRLRFTQAFSARMSSVISFQYPVSAGDEFDGLSIFVLTVPHGLAIRDGSNFSRAKLAAGA